MDILNAYGVLLNYGLSMDTHRNKKSKIPIKQNYVVPAPTPITLAEQCAKSKDFITAHDLRDYRRSSFNLVMLPSVELSYDTIAKEVYGLGDYI